MTVANEDGSLFSVARRLPGPDVPRVRPRRVRGTTEPDRSHPASLKGCRTAGSTIEDGDRRPVECQRNHTFQREACTVAGAT